MKNVAINISIATEAIMQNKLRTWLTTLGIVFGVGSVIAMLSVGKGAELEILEQMKALGANNIIIKPVMEQQDEEKQKEQESGKTKVKKWSPGLTVNDMLSIPHVIPTVEFASPEIVVECLALREGMKRTVKLVGVDSSYFTATEFHLHSGSFINSMQTHNGSAVCVIGWAAKTKFFATEEAIGKQVKCGDLWLTVVGVLQEKKINQQTLKHLGIRDPNLDVYSPYTTVLRRFRNRSMLTKASINRGNNRNDDEEKEPTEEQKNYNQLDKIIVRVKQSNQSTAIAGIISSMLERRHNHSVDFEVVVPELLLKQEQRTKDIFNIVLGAIASISLIVGGIGIMNIMLASVLERTKEIGTRRAIGATKTDIIIQFLAEAISLSIGGGFAGIILGFILSISIEKFADIKTIITPVSVAISFVVAAGIGLLFGYLPARRAADLNPIVALRYE
ncbi:MAG: ABC transporter permease [Candidatus Kapabacteria bacterium]|nr:ABC transporter permease [Candidatus Kapabacteria bacterium]